MVQVGISQKYVLTGASDQRRPSRASSSTVDQMYYSRMSLVLCVGWSQSPDLSGIEVLIVSGRASLPSSLPKTIRDWRRGNEFVEILTTPLSSIYCGPRVMKPRLMSFRTDDPAGMGGLVRSQLAWRWRARMPFAWSSIRKIYGGNLITWKTHGREEGNGPLRSFYCIYRL